MNKIKNLILLILTLSLVLGLVGCRSKLDKYKEEKIEYINSHIDNVVMFDYDEEAYEEIVDSRVKEINEATTIEEIDNAVNLFLDDIKNMRLEEEINNYLKEEANEQEYLRYLTRCYGIYNDAIVYFIHNANDIIAEFEICGYTFFYPTDCEYKVYYNENIYDLYSDWEALYSNNILDEDDIEKIHYYHTNWEERFRN